MTKLSIRVKVLLAVLSIVPLALMLGLIKFWPLDVITKEQVHHTREACESLRLPDSFKKIDSHEMVKWETAVFNFNYGSEENPEVVRNFFLYQLEDRNWKSTLENSIGRPLLTSTKDGITLSLYRYESYLQPPPRYQINCSYGIR